MAFKSVFAFSVLFLFNNCEAKPENCSEVRCELLPVGEGFASEFRRKANEKGVRLVYFNLKIGNDSYDPLELQDEFLPHRWVWANTITEPMLSLPDDYDILSMGLLTYQVRSMDVQLQDQPSGCIANLNSTCQNLAVGRMLLENVTLGSSDELSLDIPVVCVAVIKWSVDSDQRDINYNCCGMHKGTSIPSILCDLTVDKKWLGGFDGITVVLSIFMSLFILALPLALPDSIFSLQRERDEENSEQRGMLNTVAPQQQNSTGMADRQNMQAVKSDQDELDHRSNGYQQRDDESEIPVDDASPVTFSTLLLKCSKTMPNVGLSFNIKLFLVNVVVLPFVIYLQLGLYNALEMTHINESIRKRVSLGKILTNGSLFVILDKAKICWFILLVFPSLMLGLFLRPEHFMVISCPICPSSRCIDEDEDAHEHEHDDRDHSLSNEMRLHFKKLYYRWWGVIFTFAKLVTWDIFLPPWRNSRRPSIYGLLDLICIPFTLLLRVVFGAICCPLFLIYLLLLLIWYSPMTLFFLWFTLKIPLSILECFVHDEGGSDYKKIKECLIIILFGILVSMPYAISLVAVIVVSCSFINSVLGYTIAGLVLNENVITPYVAFFLVVTTNMYLCYANMQEKYKEVKEMILKCQNELQLNSNDPDGTIRTQLFWFVCDRVLPIKSEICRMFRDMVLILVFLFLVVYSVVVFGNQYKASAIFATIYVFVGGLIPVLVFKGLTKRNKFIGWAKIRIEREIEAAVNKYRNSPDNELRSYSTDSDDTKREDRFRSILRNKSVE